MSGNEKIPEHIFVYQEWDWMRERPTQIEERLERVRFDTTANTIGLSIQQARIEQRLSIQELAAQCEIATRQLTLFENGSDVPSGAILQRIKTTLKLA